jgi:hypothetical protein
LGILASAIVPVAHADRLFVGLESSPAPPTYSTDLSGFPEVVWDEHFAFEVSGAAATPTGTIYLCNGAFTTRLYEATLDEAPTLLSTLDADMSALAYGRETLFGYSNFADPKGIYAIDPGSGAVSLVLDVFSGPGYRFFALDYNSVDDRLYGYTEYGTSGLYRIDIDSGEMTFIAGPIPASNSQGRGMAVGNNTVFLTATRGDEEVPLFAYDLEQGIGGSWVGFTNPYPAHHATGGAAWVPETTIGVEDGASLPAAAPRLAAPIVSVWPNPLRGPGWIRIETSGSRIDRFGVFDSRGREVTRLAPPPLDDGAAVFEWKGTDDRGQRLPPGVYFLRASTPVGSVTQRLVVTR